MALSRLKFTTFKFTAQGRSIVVLKVIDGITFVIPLFVSWYKIFSLESPSFLDRHLGSIVSMSSHIFSSSTSFRCLSAIFCYWREAPKGRYIRHSAAFVMQINLKDLITSNPLQLYMDFEVTEKFVSKKDGHLNL